ncbi:MAG: outer membrane beta-barrel protein, partial [Vicinamibacterales bacterium]
PRPAVAQAPAAAPSSSRRAVDESAAQASGQNAGTRKSATDRFWLGVGLEGNGILANDALNSGTDSGAGLGISLGYGFTPRWSIYSVLSGASMTASDFSGTYALGHFDLGTRVHFRGVSDRVRPFVQAGLSGRAVTQDFYVGSRAYKVEAGGAGVSFGGGLNAHFRPALAFSGALTWSTGNFSIYKLNGVEVPVDSLGATSARVHLGLVWFPGARR